MRQHEAMLVVLCSLLLNSLFLLLNERQGTDEERKRQHCGTIPFSHFCVRHSRKHLYYRHISTYAGKCYCVHLYKSIALHRMFPSIHLYTKQQLCNNISHPQFKVHEDGQFPNFFQLYI